MPALTAKIAKGTGGPSGDEGKHLVLEDVPVAYSVTPMTGQGADLRTTETELSTALDARNANQHDRGIRVVQEAAVRRLTPRECERLQSFPDDWTFAHAPDTRRYAALGDAVTVSVAQWIGERIVQAHE